MNEVINSNQNVVLILIGTKIDLPDKRQVSYKDGENLAARFKMNFYEVTSILNVNHVFDNFALEIIENITDLNNIEHNSGITQTEHLEEIPNNPNFFSFLKIHECSYCLYN